MPKVYSRVNVGGVLTRYLTACYVRRQIDLLAPSPRPAALLFIIFHRCVSPFRRSRRRRPRDLSSVREISLFQHVANR